MKKILLITIILLLTGFVFSTQDKDKTASKKEIVKSLKIDVKQKKDTSKIYVIKQQQILMDSLLTAKKIK